MSVGRFNREAAEQRRTHRTAFAEILSPNVSFRASRLVTGRLKPLHKMSEAQIKRDAAVFPLEWERSVSTLPWQYVVVFRKRG